MSARENILKRIRAAQMDRMPPDETGQYLRMHARGPAPLLPEDIQTRFREQALALASTVEEIAGMDEVARAASHYLEANRLARKVVCWPEFAELDWIACGIEAETRAAAGGDLAGVTGAFCGIAETGTLMLLSGANTPATVSLLPETHFAVLPLNRIVATMEDAWDLLRAEHGRLPRAVNFVSGPSRTADIEQTVTLGAHGPYRVHILLVSC